MIDEMSTIDAFLALKDIADEEVTGMIKCKNRKLREAKEFSIHSMSRELDDAREMLDEDENKDDAELEVIDINANAKADLKPNSEYIGDAILKCVSCHSRIVLPLAQVVPAGDQEIKDIGNDDLCNVDSTCPYCHNSGKGFILENQVGKVEENPENVIGQEDKKSEEEGEEPSLDNDEKSEDDLKFDNDEGEETGEETPSAAAGEEESEEEEPEVDEFKDEPEDDGMQVDKADDSDDVEDLDLHLDDDSDDDDKKEKALNEEMQMDAQAEEAWMMNQVIEYLIQDEADYYGSWLNIWVDQCTPEGCQAYFGAGEDDAFDELKERFDQIYTAHHEEGLNNAPDNVVEFAHKQDDRLDIDYIENNAAPKQNIREAFGYNSLDDFLALIQDAENISTIVINNVEGDQIYEGSFEDLSDGDFLDKEFQGFNAADSIITFNIDSEEPHGTRLKDLLEFFNDKESEKVSIVENDEEVFNGKVEEALEQYGEAALLNIQVPERLIVTIDAPAADASDEDDEENNNGPYNTEDEAEKEAPTDEEEELFEAICKNNNLKSYRKDYRGSEEYFLKEDLNNREELDRVYEEYVAGNVKLENRFKRFYGYRDAVDEAARKLYGKDLVEEVISKSSSKELNDIAAKTDQALKTAGIEAQVAAANSNPDESILVALQDEDTRKKANPIISKTLQTLKLEPGVLKDVDDGDVRGIQVGQLKKTEVVGAMNESVRSYKNRKSLSEAIVELKNNNRPYHVRKSLTEGYRYDLICESTEAENNFKKYLHSSEAREVGMTDNMPKQLDEEVVNEASMLDKLKAARNKLSELTEDVDPEDVALIEEPEEDIVDVVEEEPEVEIEENDDCVFQTAEAVMTAYQNANKWLDSVKETIYTKLNCPFFASYVHNLAHTMPARFDKFGDILHTIDMQVPYPATAEIGEYPTNIVNCFVSILGALDAIKEALNAFIKCTDDDYHGMSCAAEACLNDIESEYPMLFRLQAKAKECGKDTVSFDKFVGQYVQHKDELLESLNEAKKKARRSKHPHMHFAGDPSKEAAMFNHEMGSAAPAGGSAGGEGGGDGGACCEELDEAKKKNELPPDPIVVKLNAYSNIENLTSDALGAADAFTDVIADLNENNFENKDAIISKLEDLRSQTLATVEELNALASKISFDKSAAKVEEPIEEVPEDDLEVPEDDLEVPEDEPEQLDEIFNTNISVPVNVSTRDVSFLNGANLEETLAEGDKSGFVIKGRNNEGYILENGTFGNLEDAKLFRSEAEAIGAAEETLGDDESIDDMYEILEVSETEENFDEDEFDDNINDYFNESFDDTIVYHTDSGYINESNQIILEGHVIMNEELSPITFTLTPSKEINEGKNNNRRYDVTNNLSDEVFELEV